MTTTRNNRRKSVHTRDLLILLKSAQNDGLNVRSLPMIFTVIVHQDAVFDPGGPYTVNRCSFVCSLIVVI